MCLANALIIAEPCLVASHVAEAWLDQGNRIAGFWAKSTALEKPDTNQRLNAIASGIPTLAAIARRHAIPVRRVERLTEVEGLEKEIERTGADTLLTVMTHLLVPEVVLDFFGWRAVNVHPSLLPNYRGKYPRHAMLYDGKGDHSGGVTFHRLTPGIDEGPIIAQRALPWSKTPHFHTWDLAHARAASEITRNELLAYLEGTRDAAAQDRSERYYRKTRWSEFKVTADKPLEEVRHLFACLPGAALRWASGASHKDHAVHSLAAVLGPPTGQPPVMGAMAIEADIADARIRMWRGRLSRATYGRPFLRILAHRLSR